MSLGLAAIDITANLAPFKEGLAKARVGVSKFTKSTSDSVSSSVKKVRLISENVSLAMKNVGVVADHISERFRIALGRIDLRIAIFKDKMGKIARPISKSFKIAFGKIDLRFAMFKEKHRRAFAIVEKVSKRTAKAIARAFKASFRAATLAMKGLSKAMPFIRRGFSKLFSFMRIGLARVIRTAKLVSFALLGIGIASVKIASDVQETDNLFKISMGSMADEAQAFATEYSKSLGLFENDTRKALGTFQLMLTSMGLGEKAAFDMSKGLVKLVDDISSFRNQRPEDVFLKLQAGITGESEPLKRLGILVNETIIKQLAMEDATIKARMAIKGASKELTTSEKVFFRYKAIVNATQKDMGDMARTLDDTANVFRVIWAQVKVTVNTIGKALLPVVTKVAIAFRDWLKGSQPLFDQLAKKVASAMAVVVRWIGITIDLLSQGKFKEVFNEIGRLFGILVNRIISILQVFLPLVAKIGFEAGAAFAGGFMRAVEGTNLGKLLKGVGVVISGAIKGAESVGKVAADFALPFVHDARPAQLSPSAQADFDTLQSQQLEQLKRLNKNIEDQSRDF